jgi:hypothetical protein
MTMRPLYEIRDDILSCVDMETGEILDVDRLDALEMEREQKLEGGALWYKDMRAESAAIKDEIDKLSARKKALDNRMESLKNWLLYALGGEKLSTPRCKVYQTHSQRVVVTDNTELFDFLFASDERDRFVKFPEPELRKDELKKALKDGQTFPGAVLEETETVVIK